MDELKRLAAEAAVEGVEDGMVLGLGTGSTAAFVLDALARRIAAGLRVEGVPTSEQTAQRARALGVQLTSFERTQRIDMTIDGADEVEVGSLDLIKGLGGALLREKIVAAASDRLVVVVDESKLVDRLGTRSPLPVEVVPFGWQLLPERLEAAGAGKADLRSRDGAPFRTDGGHHIIDCTFAGIADGAELDRRLKAVVGVVETGLFIGMASTVIVGTRSGIRTLQR